MPHFYASRPRHGVCLLDFLDVWLWQAIQQHDADRAYEYARTLAHWARRMEPLSQIDPVT
jgi:hypothetical protein